MIHKLNVSFISQNCYNINTVNIPYSRQGVIHPKSEDAGQTQCPSEKKSHHGCDAAFGDGRFLDFYGSFRKYSEVIRNV